jgi:hypothetical protein
VLICLGLCLGMCCVHADISFPLARALCFHPASGSLDSYTQTSCTVFSCVCCSEQCFMICRGKGGRVCALSQRTSEHCSEPGRCRARLSRQPCRKPCGNSCLRMRKLQRSTGPCHFAVGLVLNLLCRPQPFAEELISGGSSGCWRFGV